MFPILVMLFTIIPALEIYLLFSIGGQIGGLNTLFVVIATGIIGASLAKTQGLAILHKIQTDLNRGAIPTDQFTHGLLVFGGGLLLLTPGFLTDILGISMVFPGTRHIMASYLKHLFAKGIANGNVHFSSSFGGFSSSHREYENPFESQRNGPRQVDTDTFEAEFEKKE
ncbi:FxsA family protein [Bacteriovorax sp. DB6_IX]|uniref:FxsA family protein n=1 Tax=Bacteriovorax sp. DB6_IX TaxID=1353530 RepID=UPI00038A3469|nr:FxsA family protein [Bacteriovorax sp. DB6_IX]EQC51178.1 FxsA cytoplasmic membrane protein [Bacteriovorax sp. DB6_IX]